MSSGVGTFLILFLVWVRLGDAATPAEQLPPGELRLEVRPGAGYPHAGASALGLALYHRRAPPSTNRRWAALARARLVFGARRLSSARRDPLADLHRMLAHEFPPAGGAAVLAAARAAAAAALEASRAALALQEYHNSRHTAKT